MESSTLKKRNTTTESKTNKTETLSSLLKKFESYKPSVARMAEQASSYVTQTKLKKSWPQAEIRVTLKEKTKSGNKRYLTKSVEELALNSAQFLEDTIRELENRLETIEEEKDSAKEFARNCFIYLNKVHEGTCLGEAGKIMLSLFDKGDLSGNIIFGLLERAESISYKRNLPFANKLTPPQTKAINFMVEERDLRIAPTIENLQVFLQLYDTTKKYTPLIEAFTNEDFKRVEELLNNLV